LATPGHKVRARLCLAACLDLQIKYNDMLIISAVSELLHNASLIHDDIQDMDETRRGVETVWKKFGSSVAICAGDLLLSSAYGVLAEISDPKLLPSLIKLISKRTSSVIKGQCDDIEYKNKPINSIENYKNIAKAKSGALLGLPIELALTVSGESEYLHLAQKATTHFQKLAKQKANQMLDEGLERSTQYIEGLGLKKRRGRKKKGGALLPAGY
jgi:geranylgeranyl diphosphate synthase type II